MLRLIQLIKREMRLNASAILFVSLSAVGADKLDEPKLLKSKAKKRLRTCKDTVSYISTVSESPLSRFYPHLDTERERELSRIITYDQVADHYSG